MIGREENHLTIIFNIKVLYGTALTAELESSQRVMQIDVSKKNNPAAWNDLKDISIVDLMKFLIDNKSFIYLRGQEATEENTAEYNYLSPVYSLLNFLDTRDNLTLIDI